MSVSLSKVSSAFLMIDQQQCWFQSSNKWLCLGAIMFDEWTSYRQLASLGYTHTTVNHSQHFVDPDDGTCTNWIESYWNAVKRRFKKMYRTAKEIVLSYLDEHMWRERHGATCHMLSSRWCVTLLRGIQRSNVTASVLQLPAVGGQHKLW